MMKKQYRMKRQGTYFEFPILHGGSYFHLLKFFFLEMKVTLKYFDKLMDLME